MMYAPRDHSGICISTDNGGCGTTHNTLTANGQLVVECGHCEPVIAGMGHGWAYTPAGVAPTPDEIREEEERRRSAEKNQITTWANPNAFGEMMTKALAGAVSGGGTPAPAAPSLFQQLMALPVEERQAIAALLTPPVAVPTTEAAPVQVTLDSTVLPPVVVAAMMPMLAEVGTATTATVAPAPVKRGPGRPPKAQPAPQ